MADVDSKNDGKKIGSRAKRFMASKTTGTKLGRKAILNILGEDGEIMFNAIKEAAKVHYGEAKGKALKADLLKVIMKVNLLLNEERLTPKNTADGHEPLHQLLFQAMQDFEDPDIKVEAKAMADIITVVRAKWIRILDGFMQEKNLDKVDDVFEKLGDVKFLDSLYNSPEQLKHRRLIATALPVMIGENGMGTSVLGNRHAGPSQCQLASCSNNAVRSRGLFRSNGMCAFHHRQHFDVMLKQPRLEQFLSEPRVANFFREYLDRLSSEGNKAARVHFVFVSAVAEYRSTSGQVLRRRMALQIIDKYIMEGSVNQVELSEEVRRVLSEKGEAIEDGDSKTGLSSAFFSSAETEAREHLREAFEKGFLSSKVYERFTKAYTLPEDLQRKASVQRNEE